MNDDTARSPSLIDAREYLRDLAEGCAVHGPGFICRHTWEDLEGPAFDGGTVEYGQAMNAARARLAEAARKVLDA